jgi:enoyl-CoA hydratase
VSTITMDDGKVNVFSILMLQQLHAAFDLAQNDGTVVVLQGRSAASPPASIYRL